MWVLLSRRVRVWLVFALALPLLARTATRTADRLEDRRGHRTRGTRLLRRVGRFAGRRARPDRTGTLHKTAEAIRHRTDTGVLHHLADTLDDVAAPVTDEPAPTKRRGLLRRRR